MTGKYLITTDAWFIAPDGKQYRAVWGEVMIKEPKIGDKIYVPSTLYVYRGEDDFVGGIATIAKVEYSNHLPKDHFNYIMVGIEGRSNTMYNYKNLMSEQTELKKEYGNQIAHADPDYREEFNCPPNADWE